MAEFCDFGGASCEPEPYPEDPPELDPEYSARGRVLNDTFDMRLPSSEIIRDESFPECCAPTDLPIYRKMRDPTITTAPRRNEMIPAKKSSCNCHPTDQTMSYGVEGPLRKFPGYDDLRGIGMDESQGRQMLPTNTIIQQPGSFRRSPVQLSLNVTRNVVQASPQAQSSFNATRGGQHMRSRTNETFVTPLGFDQYYPSFGNNATINQSRNNATFNQPRNNATFNQPPASSTLNQQTYYPTQSSTGSGFYSSDSYPDMGPWKNFAIPKKLKKVNIAPSAHKTYPRSAVPAPSRNYSTYDDHQPIVNVKEVAAHRKKAPRFYSTPTTPGFANEGTNLSSVWGQDFDSMRHTETDSSIGWSKGVRMDSFNVYGRVTPSPKNVKIPVRYNVTQMPTVKKTAPAAHATHTYLQNPYPNVPNIQLNPSAESSRISPAKPNATRNLPEISETLNKTYTISTDEDPSFCAPCAANPAYSNVEPDESDKTKEGQEIEKDFCTVLEIRTPCGNKPCVPDNPLQLSIHVTCADPTYLVTPDKRFNVIGHDSSPKVTPPPPPPIEASNNVDDVPSDCECG